MKAKIIYAIPCVNKITDAESGLTTLVNILETGTVHAVPSILPSLNFSALVHFDDPDRTADRQTSFGVQVWLTRPNGKKTKMFEELNLAVAAEKIKLNTIIDQILVEEVGTHFLHLAVLMGGDKKKRVYSAKYPLDVVLAQPHENEGN